MSTKIRTLKDEIHFKPGLVLFIGRKRNVMQVSCTFEMKRPVAVLEPDEMLSAVAMVPMPDRNEYRILVGGKLFSTTHPTGTKRGSVRIIKTKGGAVQIHLVKKYTELESDKVTQRTVRAIGGNNGRRVSRNAR